MLWPSRLLAHRWIVVALLGLFGLQFTAAPVVAQDGNSAQNGNSLSPKQKKKLKKKLQQTYKEGAKAGNAKNFTVAIARFQKSIKLAKKLGLADLASKIKRKNLVESLKGAGSAALKKKNYKKALSHYEKLRQYTNQDPAVHYNRGLALINMDSTKAGLKSLKKAIDIGNKTGNTRVAGLATKRIRDEFLAKASKALQGDSPSQEKINTALDALDQMREYVDPNAKSLFYRATALFEDGQYQKAIQTARKGLDMHQGSRSDAAKFYYVIAESQWETGSKASACETFKNAAYGNYQARANHYLNNKCDDL
ncbi:MAG: tetratricopeptide repeat protein [Salinibacter sp.]